jgi:hypothetical protein
MSSKALLSIIPQTMHSLSAIVDLFMECLVFDISMDIKELQKCYELCCLPAVEVKQKSETIDDKNYVNREDRNAVVHIGNMEMLKFIM